MMVKLVLFGWPLVVLAIFASLPARRAIVASFVAGWLFLPEASLAVQGIPDYDKLTATSLGALVGCLMFDGGRLLAFRPSWVDVPILLLLIAPMPTSLSNGLGAYDGASDCLNQFLTWGVPILLGRVYLRELDGLTELVNGIIVGAMAYVPLCLIEVRLSPQLHNWVYGFHPHSFDQAIRYGGFRPMVFMDNGLAVSAYMATGTFLAFWSWRARPGLRLVGVPIGVIFATLAVTTVLCKSMTGVATALLGVAAYLALYAAPSRAWLFLLCCAPALYMFSRATDRLPPEAIVGLVASIDAERAQSLSARLTQEDVFSDWTWNRPYFGWGGWMRNFPKDEEGELIARHIDGMWTTMLSKYGLFGLFAWTATLLVGPVCYALRTSPRLWLDARCMPATALAILCALFFIDKLFNGMHQPMFVLAAGGLTSLRQLPSTTRSRVAAWRTTQGVDWKRWPTEGSPA